MEDSRKYPRKYMCDNGDVPRPATGKTPNRNLRVAENLWRDYSAACEEQGTTNSDDLRAHMLRKVKAWRKRNAQAEGGTDA